MLGNPKNVFWEALFLTVVVFFFGLLIGYAIESSRLEDINQYYANSEVSLMDILALNSIVDTGNYSCQELIKSNLEFADKIYEEAILLEDYEGARVLSDNLLLAHKKYDLLRAFLWINADKVRERCEANFSVVVYIYEQETTNLAQKATQNVWSKILFDLKQKKGQNIVLIPLAADTGLSSVETLVKKNNIERYPAVVINGNRIYELKSVAELEEYLK